MRICILTQHFPPESAAGGLRFYQMARRWALRGHEIHVVTCYPHDGEVKNVPAEETLDGLFIHRIRCAQERGGFLDKLKGQLAFSRKAPKEICSLPKPDLLLVTSPPFFCLLAGMKAARRRKIPYIADIRDLYPRSAIELGVLKNKALIRLFERLERKAYQKSLHVIPVTETIQKYICGRGIPESKVTLMTNGIDPDAVCRLPYDGALAERLNLKDKFVAAYIGTHGMSQALHKVVEAAGLLKERKDITFLMVGGGARLEDLMEQAKDLPNIQFLGQQPHEDMPGYYSVINAGIISLRNIPLFEGAIPSKTFELMASGVPVIASLSGECAGILRESGAAEIVPPESPDELAAAVVKLAESPELCRRMAESGPAFALSRFGRDRIAEEYADLMEKIVC